MNERVELPEPIETYFAAVNAGRDAKAVVSTFEDGAVIKDAGREIRGTDAIERWVRHDIFDVHARLEIIRVTRDAGRTVVTTKIDGTFDKKGLPDPLIMDNVFELKGGKISSLEITFAAA